VQLTPNDLKIKKVSEENNIGVFTFEPLPTGFGYTLGNTLRRVLLTSLEGAAVTQIKIDGVDHQFSTIEGVKEDVVELMLNFKELVFKLHTDNPVVAKISKSGECKVTAKDIEVSSDAEVINTKHHLATLTDSKAKFDVELVIEPGVGYSPVEDRESSKVGVILLDTVFSPILNASYVVEPTRMGRDIGLDKLTMTIETDGSISPEDALTKSATVLKKFFARFAEGEDEEEEVEEEMGAEAISTVKVENILLEELPLPTRTINALRKHGIQSLAELADKSEEELADIKNLGEKSIKEINKLLVKEGLRDAS